MVLHQAVWLFSYKVTNSTLSLNQIAPREISDIIRYTFLTSLGCRCVELLNNKSVWIEIHPCQRKSAHARSTTTNLFTEEETLRIQIVQCLQKRRRICTIIQHVGDKIYLNQKLNRFVFVFFAQIISLWCVKMQLSDIDREATLARLFCSGSGLQRVIAYMLQQQLFELQLLPQLQWKLIRSLAMNSLYYCFSVLCEVWLHGTVSQNWQHLFCCQVIIM